jgi:hypothetical protein
MTNRSFYKHEDAAIVIFLHVQVKSFLAPPPQLRISQKCQSFLHEGSSHATGWQDTSFLETERAIYPEIAYFIGTQHQDPLSLSPENIL